MTRQCKDCKEHKELDHFYIKSDSGNPRSYCKPCVHIRSTTWRKNNKEKTRVIRSRTSKKRLLLHGDKIRSKKLEYRNKNITKENERTRRWKKTNPDKVNHLNATRRARKRNAMPKWLTKEQINEIKSFYTTARKTSATFDESFHVDHIIPLKGDNVCGLHVPWNLQILPGSVNISKGNKMKKARSL